MHLIAQLGHLTLETPNLDRMVHEAENLLGLRITSQHEHQVSLTSNSRRAEITFVRAEAAAVQSIGLEATSAEAVHEAKRRALRAGYEILSPQPTAAGSALGFVFRGPSGHAFEIHTAVPRDQPRDYLTAGIRPSRLDHVSITVPDVPGTRDMFTDILGMKLSDTADDDSFLFMRAADGFHHSVAVVQGEPGLHHYSFETREIADLFRVCDQMRHFGRRLVWGPGHHGANAQSYFTYYRDGDGCIVEHSFGMTKIANDSIYQPEVWPTNPSPDDEWLNLWGVPPSKMYGYPGLPTSSRYKTSSAA